jgi:hypothetical protein
MRYVINMTEIGARTFYHGTKAELKPGDMLQGGYSSNYTGAAKID